MISQKRLMKDILFGRYPRCGIGRLFSGYLSVGARCSGCGLDYAVFDPGDGPAVFVILIEGALTAEAGGAPQWGVALEQFDQRMGDVHACPGL